MCVVKPFLRLAFRSLALALIAWRKPNVMLLDEPLGALDLKLREEMQVELKGLQQRLGITFVFVTHDQGEALSMADRVAVFSQGRIEQLDTPRGLYTRPRTAFVANFVGQSNLGSGRVVDRDGDPGVELRRDGGIRRLAQHDRRGIRLLAARACGGPKPHPPPALRGLHQPRQ